MCIDGGHVAAAAAAAAAAAMVVSEATPSNTANDSLAFLFVVSLVGKMKSIVEERDVKEELRTLHVGEGRVTNVAEDGWSRLWLGRGHACRIGTNSIPLEVPISMVVVEF